MTHKLGTMMWTASSAGWFVIGHVTGLLEAVAVGFACAVMAYAWSELKD